MSEHRNVATLRRGYEAFGKADMEAVTETWTDDIVWHATIPGELGGDYKGNDEVIGFFGKLLEATAGTFALEVLHVSADDEYGFVLVNATGERNGKRLTEKNVHVFKMNEDGKATEFWGFTEDAQEVVDFWS